MVSILLSILVIAVNIFFVMDYVIRVRDRIASPVSAGFFVFAVIVLGACYLLFCLYLAIDMLLQMGAKIERYVPWADRLFARRIGEDDEDRRRILGHEHGLAEN